MLSQSGFTDEKSSSTLKNLDAIGCQYNLCVGDVTYQQEVRNAFKSAQKPMAGLIHGAIILKVKHHLELINL